MSSYKKLFDDPLDPDANSDFHLSAGLSGELEGALGMGILVGIHAGAEVAYQTETSHRMNTIDESSKETLVAVELGDPDASDYFLVE